MRKRLPPRLSDPHTRDLDLLTICDHTLWLGGRKFGADEFDQHLGCKFVCEQYGFGAAIGRGSEQFEGASAVGLGRPVTTTAGIKHWSSNGGGSNRQYHTTPSEGAFCFAS